MRLTYTEVSRLPTIREKFEYLRLDGVVACPTFGSARYLNQAFYTSKEWRDVRTYIRFRDGGCDLGDPEFPIWSRPTVHHINPLTPADIEMRSRALFDPENLILCSHDTHNAIHYGDESQLPRVFVERTEGDTRIG